MLKFLLLQVRSFQHLRRQRYSVNKTSGDNWGPTLLCLSMCSKGFTIYMQFKWTWPVNNSWEDSFVVMFGGLHLEMERRCWDIIWPVLDGQLDSLFGVYGCPGNSLGSSQRSDSKALLTCSQGFLNIKS